MQDKSDDAGIIAAAMQRLEKFRLPRLLDLEKKVDSGEKLNEIDLTFLQRVHHDASKMMSIVERHPEHQSLVSKAISLYGKITEKALANEKGE